MEFSEYVKGDKKIRATKTAYDVIYKAQGFMPVTTEKAAADVRPVTKGKKSKQAD